jgi:hypothetical protein
MPTGEDVQMLPSSGQRLSLESLRAKRKATHCNVSVSLGRAPSDYRPQKTV